MKKQILQQNFQGTGKKSSNEQGSALLTLLFFAAIISFAAGNIAATARNQMHLSRLITDRTAAQQTAEGGVSRAIGYIGKNPDQFNPGQPNLPSEVRQGVLGNGEYKVRIDSHGDNYFTIVSTGTVRDQSRTVRVHARLPDEMEAFKYALLSNGVIDGAGTGQVVSDSGDGNIHSNYNIFLSGDAFISGNVSAVGYVDANETNFGGEKMENARPIIFPVLDLDYYYGIADENNQIHDGDLNLNSDRAPPGGVLWVNGDVHVGGGGRNSPATFTGLLVATGDIKQASHYRHYHKDDLPAMISRDGNIHLSGQTQILQGLVYTESGRVELSGGSEFFGAIVAWDKIDIKGNWDFIEFVQQEPVIVEREKLIDVLAWEM